MVRCSLSASGSRCSGEGCAALCTKLRAGPLQRPHTTNSELPSINFTSISVHTPHRCQCESTCCSGRLYIMPRVIRKSNQSLTGRLLIATLTGASPQSCCIQRNSATPLVTSLYDLLTKPPCCYHTLNSPRSPHLSRA